MTLYADKYRKFRKEFYTVKEEYQDILREALKALKAIYKDLKNPGEYVIIIEVEGYDCLAYVKNDWYPLEIYPTVIPFWYEGKKIYPIQEIKQVFSFER